MILRWALQDEGDGAEGQEGGHYDVCLFLVADEPLS